MASIGNLVVNLTAKTDKFRKEMRKSKAVVSDFALNATVLAGVGIGAGLLKLAADAETLQVKFRVLLKSGDKAAAMMKQIGQFAAATPFEKMDIAGAAQKLLAFNVPAGRVMGTLQNIGDISALTGNRIGELAELYGKAHVQGRLFMEDINQLTGRGIPIIQELAKQFGVAESEVRNLVSTGQVSSKNIAKAFADMTSAGGQFEDGMAQLSETAAGKFSTFTDNLKQLGEIMGGRLLPIANNMLTSITKLVQSIAGWGKILLRAGFAITAVAVALRGITLATRAYASAMAVAQALSGPAGWVTLGVSLVAAAGAMLAVDEIMGDVADTAPEVSFKMDELEEGFNKTGAAVKSAADRLKDYKAAMEEAGDARWDFQTEQSEQLAQSLESLKSPAEIAAQDLAKFVKQVRLFVVPEQRQDFINQFIDKQSGFSSAMKSATDDLAVLQGSVTKTDLMLAEMGKMGASTQQLDELRAVLDEIEKIETQKDNAAKIKSRGLTPSQQRGSAEALTTILKAQQGDKKTPQVKEQQKTNGILRGMAAVMERQRERDVNVWVQEKIA
jgi:tape measure domain-containing protein